MKYSKSLAATWATAALRSYAKYTLFQCKGTIKNQPKIGKHVFLKKRLSKGFNFRIEVTHICSDLSPRHFGETSRSTFSDLHWDRDAHALAA